MPVCKITSQKTGSNSTTKLPSRENAIQLNNTFNILAVNDSVDEAEQNVLSRGANLPFANLPSTNLFSTQYPEEVIILWPPKHECLITRLTGMLRLLLMMLN